MRDTGERALGEDGVHLRPHLALGLQEVLSVPYPNLAVVAHGEQSMTRDKFSWNFKFSLNFQFPSKNDEY